MRLLKAIGLALLTVAALAIICVLMVIFLDNFGGIRAAIAVIAVCFLSLVAVFYEKLKK